MTMKPDAWVLLVYRIPSQPSRLRLQVWRKLQRMGAVYLQNAVCILPSRDDLAENMQYVAAMIEEMGGTSHLFAATSILLDGDTRLEEEFRAQADEDLTESIGRLDKVRQTVEGAASLTAIEQAEEELKRERVSYLRTRRLAYFGSSKEAEVDARLEGLKRALDDIGRGTK
jgi:DNA-binding transcriptional regulator PaaX